MFTTLNLLHPLLQVFENVDKVVKNGGFIVDNRDLLTVDLDSELFVGREGLVAATKVDNGDEYSDIMVVLR